ncbi:PREDICTED: uncharacterized protein LOC102825433 [Chrysochloris asiatica]|uniref:Uncharacterized protein LOC102825433 n=1 Tax=Chrysochloris asiatica TaxID=185453 RepID=A0A9B0T4T7_CHRAS|nr:PREDICTED: uncharacterized protein LOC102825433 [Chrysochloris asiatica]
MLLLPILVFGVTFALREARAQSVTQPDVQVSVTEGLPLELKCNYSYSAASSRFWYVKYPNQGLQLLLKDYSGQTRVKGSKDFEAEFKKSESSFNLKKQSAHWDDSAEYFCAVSDTVLVTAGGAEHKLPETAGRLHPQRDLVLIQKITTSSRICILTQSGQREARAQSVTQPDIRVSITEGLPLELKCNYSYSGTPDLYWYVKHPNEGLQLLLKYYSGNTLVKGSKGFEAEFKKSESSFNLRKGSAHWDDSAEYFCAFCSHFRACSRKIFQKRVCLHCLAMFLLPILVYGVTIALREARGQSVTQPDVQISVTEGLPLELKCNCSYSTTPYLFWYVKYPNEGLQLLLKYYSGNTLVKGNKDFEAEFKKSESSFNLRKRSAHLDDSAEYFCALPHLEERRFLGMLNDLEHVGFIYNEPHGSESSELHFYINCFPNLDIAFDLFKIY